MLNKKPNAVTSIISMDEESQFDDAMYVDEYGDPTKKQVEHYRLSYEDHHLLSSFLLPREHCFEDLMIEISEGTVDVDVRDALSQTPLHLACKTGHHEVLEFLLIQGANVDAVDLHGRTALHLAAARRDVRAADLLLGRGADPGIKTLDGFSPLLFAVQAGCSAVVEILVNRGCDVNELVVDRDLNRQYSYLHSAVERNLVVMVETLVRCKADVNKRDCYGNTSLHSASRHGRSDIARLLLAHGARVHERDHNDLTALYLAVDGGHKDLFELLLLHGADLNDRGVAGTSLLHLAIKHGDLDFVDILLSKGADVDAATRFGKTPLHYAIAEKNWSALELLLSRGADVNRREHYGKTPLHSAIESCRKEAFQILLRHRADTNARDNLLQTPLHAAVKQGCPGTVQLLLQYGAAVDARDSNGQTALHLAVKLGYAHLFELLTRFRADINALDRDGNTPLHLAVVSEHSKLLYLLPEFTFFACLLNNGADLDKRTFTAGETALHLAVGKRCAAFAKKLLSRGAAVNARKLPKGKTPLHVAVENADSECVEYLLVYGADAKQLDEERKSPIDLINSWDVARVFARHLLKKSVAGLPVSDAKATALMHREEDDDFRSRCLDEIKRMTATRIYGDVTYYDFLRGTRRSLVGFVKNHELVAIFEQQMQKSVFPIYADMLERNYVTGKRFETILDDATERLSAACKHQLPRVPLEKIISYMNDGDMKNLLVAVPTLPIAFAKNNVDV